MNDTQRAATFAHWWKTAGHWVEESPRRALATWQGRGVHGLPDCTPGAAALVAAAPWVADSESWLAKLRAKNAAADVASGDAGRLARAVAWVRQETDPAALAAFYLDCIGLESLEHGPEDEPPPGDIEAARAAILECLADHAARLDIEPADIGAE